jgi:choline dehydrogenase-like flavoprotein
LIYDLAHFREAAVERTADVVIIGGGIAGLALAHRLAHRFRVLVLESGSMRPSSEANRANTVEFAAEHYRAATDGRTRALGGTSHIWGGALLPFRADDFHPRADLELPQWPIGYQDLASHFDEIEQLFRLSPGPFDKSVEGWLTPNESTGPFVARYAKWPSHMRRNVANLFRNELERADGPEVWIEATCAGFSFAQGKLRAVTALSPIGNRIVAKAHHFVLAAGAIESTRLLQWALAQPNAPQLDRDGPLGRYLHDHVSSRVADIETLQPKCLNELAGFRFEGSTMRSFRLELQPHAQRRLGLAGAFAHIAVAPVTATGFEGLRGFMRGLQSRRLDVTALTNALADAPYLAKAAYWRLLNKQLLWPTPARYELHCVVEQLPAASNHISLTEKHDRFGVPMARIEWRVGDFAKEALLRMRGVLDDFWRQSLLGNMGRLNWTDSDASVEALPNTLDIFHPGGTTRMGANARTSVVDEELTVWSVPNLSIASTSVFPTGASANPTMTLIALTLRLGDHLARLLASSEDRAEAGAETAAT